MPMQPRLPVRVNPEKPWCKPGTDEYDEEGFKAHHDLLSSLSADERITHREYFMDGDVEIRVDTVDDCLSWKQRLVVDGVPGFWSGPPETETRWHKDEDSPATYVLFHDYWQGHYPTNIPLRLVPTRRDD